MYEVFKETKTTKIWDEQRKCYLDPEGNHAIDPKTVDFDALVATLPTATEYYAKKKKEKISNEEESGRNH
ncbi:hypothetical protein Hanom_Chr17g01551631 [Helianthus anomalus]